ncbi:histone-lysine N-methyltransferase SETMAR [Trichonephila clavipes]|uniref:Histone-lysine N-methyltransferase SETMAR n=1 Tax=Trichonephila clavipes TaxID=2585209 RepID=A0A8X6WLR0_TRICX|nr:histone-lysine N-methyltransferase SETMAR [Trichonephila clavipes]
MFENLFDFLCRLYAEKEILRHLHPAAEERVFKQSKTRGNVTGLIGISLSISALESLFIESDKSTASSTSAAQLMGLGNSLNLPYPISIESRLEDSGVTHGGYACVDQRTKFACWTDAPRTGRSVVENVDKITEITEVDQHVSSRSIAHELNIDHKAVLNHLRKVGLKKKLDVWMPHQLTPKNMMVRISICEALGKRNEIDPFLKWMVTGDEKGFTYDNIVRKRS